MNKLLQPVLYSSHALQSPADTPSQVVVKLDITVFVVVLVCSHLFDFDVESFSVYQPSNSERHIFTMNVKE